MRSGERKRKRPNLSLLRGRGRDKSCKKSSVMVWKDHPKRVTDPWAKTDGGERYQSTTGHVESGGKTGGPSSKPKYYLMTDSGAVL